MDKSIISMWGVPQCLKEIKESWRKWQMQSECAWYASLAQLWTYCFLLPLPLSTTTISSYEQATQLCKWCNLWLCRGVRVLSSSAALLNYTTLGKEREKYTPSFKEIYQSYLESLNPSSWAERHSLPLPVHPTYHCLEAGGVRSLIGLHFKHIFHARQWASSRTISEPQNTLGNISTRQPITPLQDRLL